MIFCIDRSMPGRQCANPQAAYRYADEISLTILNTIWQIVLWIATSATDVELAKNLGCRAILLQEDTNMLKPKSAGGEAACEGLEDVCVLATKDWDKVAEFLFAGERESGSAPYYEKRRIFTWL